VYVLGVSTQQDVNNTKGEPPNQKKMGPENISSVPFDVEKFAEFKDDFFNKTKIADLSPANSVQAGKKHWNAP